MNKPFVVFVLASRILIDAKKKLKSLPVWILYEPNYRAQYGLAVYITVSRNIPEVLAMCLDVINDINVNVNVM